MEEHLLSTSPCQQINGSVNTTADNIIKPVTATKLKWKWPPCRCQQSSQTLVDHRLPERWAPETVDPLKTLLCLTENDPGTELPVTAAWSYSACRCLWGVFITKQRLKWRPAASERLLVLKKRRRRLHLRQQWAETQQSSSKRHKSNQKIKRSWIHSATL